MLLDRAAARFLAGSAANDLMQGEPWTDSNGKPCQSLTKSWNYIKNLLQRVGTNCSGVVSKGNAASEALARAVLYATFDWRKDDLKSLCSLFDDADHLADARARHIEQSGVLSASLDREFEIP